MQKQPKQTRNVNRNRRNRGKPANGDGATAIPSQVSLMFKPLNSLPIYKFVRTTQLYDVAKGAVDAGVSYSFTLANAPGYSEFTTLFDQYRISMVEVTFVLVATTALTNDPTLWMAADYDAIAAPASLTALQQRDVVPITLGPSRLQSSFKIKPRISTTAVDSGGAIVASPLLPVGTWIDCADASVAHNGIIGWFSNYNTTSAASLVQVSVRYHLEFRTSR